MTGRRRRRTSSRNTSWSGERRSFPTTVQQQILAEEPRCRHCGRPSTVADHITPVAEGGSHDRSNGQGLCDNCHEPKTRAEIARGRARHARRRPPEPHPGIIDGGG